MNAPADLNAQPDLQLLVVEQGAALPEPNPDDELGDIVVVIQRDGERPAEVALRATGHIARAERSGHHIRNAVLVVADKNDGQALAFRTLLARALITHQVQAGSGEVVISAPKAASAGVRHELMALAGTLMSELGEMPVAIRVLFGSELFGSHSTPDGSVAEGCIESGIHSRVERD